jgi:hypothetical protein
MNTTTPKPMTDFQVSVARLLMQDHMPDDIGVKIGETSYKVRRALVELRHLYGVQTLHGLALALAADGFREEGNA